jgi:hypothetical protein
MGRFVGRTTGCHLVDHVLGVLLVVVLPVVVVTVVVLLAPIVLLHVPLVLCRHRLGLRASVW